ncbi:hypothetical protein [Massilia sp. CFBP9026]|uniref:hypothetical protein n=1 Tax=Massilia sp. CFBP9026 TaxID=3096536 RepID=UPI002A6A7A17|nr:hypothetical protein [Massilia sp. CFBP9026]MDY0963374.1 hypothetical protein [Massilia sp. CFBP9026]
MATGPCLLTPGVMVLIKKIHISPVCWPIRQYLFHKVLLPETMLFALVLRLLKIPSLIRLILLPKVMTSYQVSHIKVQGIEEDGGNETNPALA